MMLNNNIINTALTSPENSAIIHKAFSNSLPFRHVVIDNILNEDFAMSVSESFPSLSSMKTKYKGLNEQKAEDSSFEIFSPAIQQLHNYIGSLEFTEWITDITGFKDICSLNDRLGNGLHQGGNNSFLDIHIDYNIHPVKKMHRKLNLILFFNKEWDEEWGGLLELWDKEKCFKKILPSFNRLVIFECNEISYHGYGLINCPEKITRKSYYHYFLQKVPKGLTYHDTIFLVKQQDKFSKKIITKSKELAKNKIKLFFFKIGFYKYLK
jgi:Rps23 Pro-64 3,4-dihydroxylase Tpa1-like proline 4-hydroxylase